MILRGLLVSNEINPDPDTFDDIDFEVDDDFMALFGDGSNI